MLNGKRELLSGSRISPNFSSFCDSMLNLCRMPRLGMLMRAFAPKD